MNIFYLDSNVIRCAAYHCDKHIVKMILEYAQLLSTAHRVLDGLPYRSVTSAGRRLTRYRLDDPRESLLYKATHANHPSAVWVRQSPQHYTWLHDLLQAVCHEYTRRYRKTHKVERTGLLTALAPHPVMIPTHLASVPPPLAMPDDCKTSDHVLAYRRYYRHHKRTLAQWRYSQVPTWFTAAEEMPHE